MKKANIEKFNTLLAGDSSEGIFGLPFHREESNIVILPVPWEVTTSYGRGTVNGPECIAQASAQLDLYSLIGNKYGVPNPWHFGIYMEPISEEIKNLNTFGCELSLPIIATGGEISNELLPMLTEVNSICEKLNSWVFEQSEKIVAENKIPLVIGGDHAVPFGTIQALCRRYKNLSILHIDAHADLRHAYEGFENSHASIFYNVVHKIPELKKLVQVGIRDFSEEEYILTETNPKIKTYFDTNIEEALATGKSWNIICTEIVEQLSDCVYISFDIDGLNPALCPNTGTPVPGGLSFFQAQSLCEEIVKQGKKIVGADLCEVAPSKNLQNENSSSEWDANVGARVLYMLCTMIFCSQMK
jgi:agmatinase